MMDKGKKYDQGKPRFDLIDPYFELQLAKVLTHGANKYSPNNWQDIDNFEARYTAALLRHINEWRHGRIEDEETDLHHLAHAACNIMFLIWGDRYGYKELPRESENRDGSIYASSKSDDQCRCKADADETAVLQQQIAAAITEFFDNGGSHELVRTCLNDICAVWDFSSVPSADHKAPNR